ncbi:MAG: Jag N-terminal domain-containing protein, partial [Eubacterium sp.]|nr:Jag N-terminal domain-containing protein [Eubacterium sp.]
MDYIEVSGKTIDDAITEALVQLGTTSDKLEYEVVEQGSSGFLGIGNKEATIRARKKGGPEEDAKAFLADILKCMDVNAEINTSMDEVENSMDIDIEGDGMGILIGKRGQTLDAL